MARSGIFISSLYSPTPLGSSRQKFPVGLEDLSTALGKAQVQPMRENPSFCGCAY